MLQAANIHLFNPIFPKAHNSVPKSTIFKKLSQSEKQCVS